MSFDLGLAGAGRSTVEQTEVATAAVGARYTKRNPHRDDGAVHLVQPGP